MAKISSPSETRKLLPSVYVRQSKRRQGLLSGKWTRVVIFGLALALCTRFFAAWSQYRGLLVRGGKYRWVCNPEDIQVDAYGYESCNEQINRLSELFMISSAAEPLGSIVAGILFDALGPRFASLIGVTMMATGLLCTVFSSEYMNLLPTGAILSGLAVNIVAIAPLILEDQFPDNQALAASYTLGMQGLASLIAPMMTLVWNAFPSLTYEYIWLTYITFIFCPIAFCHILASPRIRESLLQDHEMAKAIRDHKGEAPKSVAQSAVEMGANLGGLLTHVVTLEFISITIISAVCLLMGSYYFAVVDTASGPNIGAFLGWTGFLDTVYGLALGALCDVIKTPPMIILDLCGFAIVYLLVLSGPGPLQYFTTQLLLATLSFAYIFKYTYAQERFPPSVRGTLCGLASSIGGLAILLLDVMLKGSVEFWCLTLPFVCISLMPLALYMWYLGSKKSLEKSD